MVRSLEAVINRISEQQQDESLSSTLAPSATSKTLPNSKTPFSPEITDALNLFNTKFGDHFVLITKISDQIQLITPENLNRQASSKLGISESHKQTAEALWCSTKPTEKHDSLSSTKPNQLSNVKQPENIRKRVREKIVLAPKIPKPVIQQEEESFKIEPLDLCCSSSNGSFEFDQQSSSTAGTQGTRIEMVHEKQDLESILQLGLSKAAGHNVDVNELDYLSIICSSTTTTNQPSPLTSLDTGIASNLSGSAASSFLSTDLKISPKEDDTSSSTCSSSSRALEAGLRKSTRGGSLGRESGVGALPTQISESFMNIINKVSADGAVDKKFQCKVCGSILASKNNLKIHMRVHSGERPYPCNLCGAAYTQKSNLNLHMMKHSGVKPYQCEFCGMKFRQSGNLQVHRRVHTGERPYSCKVCKKSFAQHSSLKVHERTHSGIKPYKCSICDKSFAQKSSCELHEKIHLGDKPHECNVCHRRFTLPGNLQTHMRRHTGEKMHECEHCGKAFIHKSVLEAHKRVHSGERPFQCNVCGKAFSQQSTLHTHMKIHSGDRPHKCTYCEKSFKDTAGLKTHLRVHTGERPFRCDICQKDFRQQGSLIVHKRTHSGERPFSCNICGKAFAQQSSMHYHMRTHNGEKPCVCTICNASFAHPGNLQTHMRKHSGERPFLCELCGKTFIQPASLKAHVRAQHMSQIQELTLTNLCNQQLMPSSSSSTTNQKSPIVPDFSLSMSPSEPLNFSAHNITAFTQNLTNSSSNVIPKLHPINEEPGPALNLSWDLSIK